MVHIWPPVSSVTPFMHVPPLMEKPVPETEKARAPVAELTTELVTVKVWSCGLPAEPVAELANTSPKGAVAGDTFTCGAGAPVPFTVLATLLGPAVTVRPAFFTPTDEGMKRRTMLHDSAASSEVPAHASLMMA